MTKNELNGNTKECDDELSKELTKQVAKGGGITLFGRVGGKVIKFVFQIFLTRILGASAYGLYSLGYTVLGMSNRFSQLGLNNGVVRFGSMYRGEEDEARLKGTLLISLTLSFLAGIVIAVLLFLFARPISITVFNFPELVPVLRLFSISLPFYTLMFISAHSARIFRKMQYDVGVRLILHPLALIFFSGIAFLLGYQLSGVIYGFLSSSVLSAAVGFYLVVRLFPELTSGLEPEFEFRRILSFSFTVLLTGLSGLLIMRVDRIMLGILSTAKNVGIYNAASVMAGQMTIFLGSMNAIFSPIISDLHNKENIAELEQLFKIVTKWIFTLTFPIFLTFLLFSRPIMGLFGPEFRVGWVVLQGLVFAQLINASVGSSGFMLNMTGHQKIELGNNLVLGMLNVSLNYLLIPRFGIIGAAIATGSALALVNLARLVEVGYHLHFHPYKLSFWKPLFAGVSASLIIVLLQNKFGLSGLRWIPGAVLVIIIYIFLLIMLGLDEEDELVIGVIKRKLSNI